MVVKRFGQDFDSDGGALTLSSSQVSEDPDVESGVHSRTHNSGWTITGEVHEDYYTWVNEFEACHPAYGRIHGNFEVEVIAETEEAFEHFYQNHKPDAWDYMDI